MLNAVRNKSQVATVVSNYLRFSDEEKNGNWGSITPAEEKALRNLVVTSNVHDGPIIEFGSLFGLTTLLITNAKDDKKEVIALENFSWNPFGLSTESHRNWTSRCLELAISKHNVKLVEMDILDFKTNYAESSPSLVFLDADHSYEAAKSDIQWAKKVGTRIISGHDFSDEWPGVKQAVQEEFGSNFEVVESFWWSVQ
jgi:predicted O-methyltransferase YrrM